MVTIVIQFGNGQILMENALDSFIYHLTFMLENQKRSLAAY